MKIIGRRAELKELLKCERSGKSELVCVYGRRRVGKTFLIEQRFGEEFAFRATGVEGGNTRTQLKSFNQRLQKYGDTVRTIPKDWFEAFSRLEGILSRDDVIRSSYGKIVVFFDEFPWFATKRSDFLMAFGEFWNRCGTTSRDFMFIICGSATSWIIGNVIENTGSLYNRVTSQIFLEPFTLKESEQFFTDREFDWSRRQIAECQMVFGGLPYFFDLLHSDESLTQNIDRLCFKPNAILRNESKKLLESTLKKSPIYGKIIEILSNYKYGITKARCLELLSIPAATFTRAVEDLIKCGYVYEYIDHNKKGRPKCLYLSDPFLLFHYKFLSGKNEERPSFFDFTNEEGAYANWRGNAFEVMCLYHFEQIKEALGIRGVRTVHYPWVSEQKSGGAQIDIVIERDDGIIDLCELKYTNSAFKISEGYEQELLHKIEVFKSETQTKRALKLVMICAEGIAGTAHTEHISEILTLDDLFDV